MSEMGLEVKFFTKIQVGYEHKMLHATVNSKTIMTFDILGIALASQLTQTLYLAKESMKMK
jgi:hypothetical protein